MPATTLDELVHAILDAFAGLPSLLVVVCLGAVGLSKDGWRRNAALESDLFFKLLHSHYAVRCQCSLFNWGAE